MILIAATIAIVLIFLILPILLILIVGGFIMLSLGIIGHYLARIYEEVKGRPRYIIKQVTDICKKNQVEHLSLFGSYAKGKANPISDVDLLISSNVKGLKFYGLVEEIRTALHKKVDVLDVNQLKDNLELMQEILKDGVKIYG